MLEGAVKQTGDSQPAQHTSTWHPWRLVTKCRVGKIDPAVPPTVGILGLLICCMAVAWVGLRL